MIKERKHFRHQSLIILFFTISLLTACGEKKTTDQELQQAFELHQEAIKVRQTTGAQIDELETTEQLLTKADLDTIRTLLKAWDDQLVEVPGFEAEHDHSGHDHGHGHHDDLPNLTPQQHLQIQQLLLQEIKAIAQKTAQIQKQYPSNSAVNSSVMGN